MSEVQVAVIVEQPCHCQLAAMFDPDFKSLPCACMGAPLKVIDGKTCVLAYVNQPHLAHVEPPEYQLAALCARRPDDMTLVEWKAEIQRLAREVLA